MNFLEKDLEEIIWEADKHTLFERGFPISGKRFRQLRIGNYGVADIITAERIFDGENFHRLLITIYEFKKDSAGISAFLQAVRYMKGIDRYLKWRRFKFGYCFNIVICAKRIEMNDYTYLCDFIYGDFKDRKPSSLRNFSYKYGIDGIEFTRECNYSLKKDGFS